VRALFEPEGFAVVPGGRERTPASHPTLEPGDAVAVDVMRGDLNLSALGTVTYRDGDRILLFGHPFFQSGDVRLPLSTAHITTVLGSLSSSFKLGVPGTPVGTATQDRRTAVAGRLGPAPRLLPIRVRVAGASPRAQVFRYETIDDRTPAAAAREHGRAQQPARIGRRGVRCRPCAGRSWSGAAAARCGSPT
jgi:hypothetical protein